MCVGDFMTKPDRPHMCDACLAGAFSTATGLQIAGSTFKPGMPDESMGPYLYQVSVVIKRLVEEIQSLNGRPFTAENYDTYGKFACTCGQGL